MKQSSHFRNTLAISEDNLWSTPDVAKYLRCSERQVFNLRQQGLPAIHVGGMIRFDQQQVRDWLSEADDARQGDERSQYLADVAATGDDDNSECATADLAREFPLPLP